MKACVVLLTLVTGGAAAQGNPALDGVFGYLKGQIEGLEQQYVSLAEKLPADRFTYRPGQGVRSSSEVFMHVAGSNYNFLRAVGVAVPEGITLKGFETSTTDKAKVIEALKASFAHAKAGLERFQAGAPLKPVKLFGREVPAFEVTLVMSHHLHEHLGQLIAYARVNGVVPPWTEERQRQQAR
jgi:uncharacterized damage-inducible protein DinB